MVLQQTVNLFPLGKHCVFESHPLHHFEDEHMIEEQAISFVMDFYKVEREVACRLYRDEIEAFKALLRVESAGSSSVS